MKDTYELDPCDLRYMCEPDVFEFESTADIEPLDEVIGQARAVQAIDFGLNMKSPGYNIFVTGIEGTGKSTITNDITRKHAETMPTPDDWCMVNNFQDPYRPKPLSVPSGKGVIISRQMDRLVQTLKNKLPKTFEDSAFQEKMNSAQETFAKQEVDQFKKLEQKAHERKLSIAKTNVGLQAIPVRDGKPLTQEDFQKLPKETQQQIETAVQEFQKEIDATIRDVNKIRQERGKSAEKLMAETTLSVVEEQMDFIMDAYEDCAEIKAYLQEVREDIVENVRDFLPSSQPAEKAPAFLFQPETPRFRNTRSMFWSIAGA